MSPPRLVETGYEETTGVARRKLPKIAAILPGATGEV
jgi:hypothetical protein